MMTEQAHTIETRSYEKQIEFTPWRSGATDSSRSRWWMPTTGSGGEGEELHLSFPPGPAVMRVEATQPSSQVAWRVLACDFQSDWVGTRIVFALHERGDGAAVLEFCHEGMTRQLECYDQCRQGWDYYLASLRDYVETGTGRPGDRHTTRAQA